MVLCNSTRTGEDVRINTDHRFLVQAAEMGFRQLHLFGPNGAILARDDQRTYLWMPLGPDNMILPADDCLRIESPRVALPSSPTSSVPRSTLPMNRQPLPATASTHAGRRVCPSKNSHSPPSCERRERQFARSGRGAAEFATRGRPPDQRPDPGHEEGEATTAAAEEHAQVT